MPVYQKNEFYDKAIEHLAQFPTLAARVQAGDVLITQQIGAIAQMFSMLSLQIGLGETERWTKARDSMVLADAAKKGILPFAKSPVWKLNVKNNTDKELTINAGRRLRDAKGKIWIVRDGVTIPALGIASLTAIQKDTTIVKHEVLETKNFYTIPIEKTEVNQYIGGIEVFLVQGTSRQKMEHTALYNNISDGDMVHQFLIDELLNVSVEFGLKGVAGYVPSAGEKVEIEVSYTVGETDIPNATPFTFEYIFASESEKDVEIYADSLIYGGANPLSINELREMTNFPSMYEVNAVYLGEFQYLLMRHLNPFIFLSVWNEQLEEKVRGAKFENINKIFVSFIKEGMDTEETKKEIIRLIEIADDSYKVVFVETIEKQINIKIELYLSPVHDEDSVKVRVQELILERYGRGSDFSKKGRSRINLQSTASYLKNNIPELQDNVSDLSVFVSNDPIEENPEYFRYVSKDSLVITNTSLKSY